MNAEATQHILAAAKQKQCQSAAAIAAKVQQKSGLKVSVSTVQRSLKRGGLNHQAQGSANADSKIETHKFATAAQRSDTVCWRNTMVTDSSIFTMHAMGKPAGSWCTQATRGTARRPNHSLGVHYYMGMTYWGVTKTNRCTIQLPISPGTKAAASGPLYRLL